jgi:ubiquinol-cytochrome c reductase cytochrome b subunit
LGLSIVHIILLHEFGSNNPMGISSKQDGINFFPAYIIKDMYSWFMLFGFMCILVFFMPNLLGHPDNYILGNALVTPTHIVPEWYFLPLYAILRSIPSKLMGLVVLVLAIITLLCLP